jgi:hypothetical protein
MSIERMWVNQPSTLQPLHNLHGTCVLAEEDGEGFARIWFLKGPVANQRAPWLALSNGWPDHLTD